MAREEYRFFNSNDEDRRLYGASDFADYFTSFFTDGILIGGDALTVKAVGGMEVSVNYGSAMLGGYLYKLSPSTDGEMLKLAFSMGDTKPRIDRVVLRLNLHESQRNIKPFIIKGVPDTSPLPPDLTRNENIHEISLARVTVNQAALSITQSDITDERGDNSVCGYTSGHGQPAYQPPTDVPAIVWDYALFPETLTPEQRTLVENTPGLTAMWEASRIAHAAPPSAIMSFAAVNVPNGWLKCDGSAVSRTVYARLFAAVGTKFGAGNGSTTFTLPDLRSEFIRGWTGVESNIGVKQTQDMQSHNHTIGAGNGSVQALMYSTNMGGATITVQSSYAGGSETRPRNMALLMCIKY